MEVGSTSLIAPPEPAARPAVPPVPETENSKSRNDTTVLEAAIQDLAARKAPTVAEREVRLDVDRNSGRVVGTVFDKKSGDVVAQIPSEEILALLEKTREMLGPLVDRQA